MMSNMIKSLTVSVAAIAMAASASAEVGDPWDPNYEPPRMADGTVDMQGIWTSASLTVLERNPPYTTLTIPESQAAMVAKMVEASAEADNQASDVDAPAPEAGGAGVGGYNRFWMDFGSSVAKINGEYRTSWIVEPEDGKLPWSKAGLDKMAEYRATFAKVSDPEFRTSGERCTVGFGSTGGPPHLNVLYNNNYQIVQSPDTFAIRVEMNHNTRLIRVDGELRPPHMLGWLGDSVGSWDGDTFVVTSTNFHPGNEYRGAIRHRILLSEDAKVTERFTRVSDDELFYEFTVDEPDYYEKPWKGEMTWRKTEGPIYEYACHEGNYSLPGILAGARKAERDAAAAAAGGSQ